MTINIQFGKDTVRVAVELNGGIESAMTYLPKREWVGLTNEEIQELHTRWNKEVLWDEWNYERAIEARLKEKNT